MKKFLFSVAVLVGLLNFANDSVEIYDNRFPDENYILIKNKVNVRENPTTKSKVLGMLLANKKIEVVSKDGNWYEINYKDQRAYVSSSLAVKREFRIDEAILEIIKQNDFINDNLTKIKVIDYYTPLNTGTSRNKDKYGNTSNQSIIAYTEDKKTYYNLPDRSLIVVIGENSKYIIAKSLLYKETLYIPKTYKRFLKNSKIDEVVNKYIFVDRKNQNEMLIERDVDTDEYNIVLKAYITSGKNSKYGFETPYGNFLAAIAKPAMLYASDIEPEKIIGDAKYALRFTGGAYLHGIPSVYEPAENREARKRYTASRLGTYPLSHKCVRQSDETAKYVYNWVGVKSTNKYGYRTPAENVIIIVR